MEQQDFLADIRRMAREMLSEDHTSGMAAVLLGLVSNAERERDALHREIMGYQVGESYEKGVMHTDAAYGPVLQRLRVDLASVTAERDALQGRIADLEVTVKELDQQLEEDFFK